MVLDLIKEFDKYVKDHNLSVESICLSDKNGILFEEHYNGINVPRNIYSHSKSFVSIMCGIAIDEKKLSLNDHIVDILKDDINNEYIEKHKSITIKDCLSMQSGIGEGLLFEGTRRQGVGYPDYLNFILSHDQLYSPGTKFVYSNGDTYLVSRCIEKIYGDNLNNICYEKIFKPLDMGYPLWETDPMGHCLAASGLRLTISNMNKLGILFLNEGIWNGKQIISKDWINKCFEKKVIGESTWHDYSYFFWFLENDLGIRADGAYGQFTFILPKFGYCISMHRKEDYILEDVLKIFKEMVLFQIK